MLITTIVIVAIVLFGCIMMSSVQISHINRAAVAMFCGVSAWVVYMLHGSDFLNLMGYPDYQLIGQVDDYIASNVIVKYINEACQVILFLIATNTIVEIMNNNGVFDSLIRWLRTHSSRLFLWELSLLTFTISANVDNLTTVVLMMTIMDQIVNSRQQKIIYSCVILISAILGGSFTVIGDMTSLMLWVHGVVTPSAYAGGLILPVLASLCIFNLLISSMLVGRVEVSSFINRYQGDDSLLRPWQKLLLLFIGIAGLWSIPTFHNVTKLPPFLGALCVLALIWLLESAFTFKRNGNRLFIQHKYIRNTEFIGMPTPANAIFWGALIVSSEAWLTGPRFNALFLFLFMILFCWLLVCEVPMFAFKGRLSWPKDKMKIIFLVLSVLMLGSGPFLFRDVPTWTGVFRSLAVCMGLYVVMSIVASFLPKEEE